MNKLATVRTRAATQADQAYEALLAEILDCRLAPGAKIIISDVAARLGFSPGAIREALSRLAAEKWTVATAQKGYSVTPVSADELRDLTRTRITIEQLCLRPQLHDGDVEWETAAVAAYHRLHRIPMMVRTAVSRVNPAWASRTPPFTPRWSRAATVRGCSRYATMLYAQSERYRHLSVALARENRDVDAEHERILNACLARDAESAVHGNRRSSPANVKHLLTSPAVLGWAGQSARRGPGPAIRQLERG